MSEFAAELTPRRAERKRNTKETTIDASLLLDGTGIVDVSTGLPFFDHMVEQLGRHASFDLTVHAQGDLHVDAHHTVEDVGIVLGACLAEALGDKRGIRRFASMLLPLDEALMEVALDLSGRPFLAYDLEFAPDTVGLGTPPFDPQLAEEFWRAFATAGNLTGAGRARTRTTCWRRASRAWPAASVMPFEWRAGGSRQPRGPCERAGPMSWLGR
jgi:imidazoleglycerol-phosphate dehydratase